MLALGNLRGDANRYKDTNKDPIVPMIRAAVEPLKTKATKTSRDPSTTASKSRPLWNFHSTTRMLKARATPKISISILASDKSAYYAV